MKSKTGLFPSNTNPATSAKMCNIIKTIIVIINDMVIVALENKIAKSANKALNA